MPSFSPEPLTLTGGKAGYKTPGMEVCPEIAKTSLTDVSLACLPGDSYDFEVYLVVKGVCFPISRAAPFFLLKFSQEQVSEIGMPAIKNFREKRMFKTILDMRYRERTANSHAPFVRVYVLPPHNSSPLLMAFN